MHSVTEPTYEMPPGQHFARIVARATLIPDVRMRREVIESARILLQRGDR
jgi:hypothetical protein